MKNIILLLSFFVMSCSQSNDTEKNLLSNNQWPKPISGEIVIADAIADDTGIIWATGWIEVLGSEDRVGINFEGEILQKIDLNYDPIGNHKVWVNPPKDIEFEVVRVEKL